MIKQISILIILLILFILIVGGEIYIFYKISKATKNTTDTFLTTFKNKLWCGKENCNKEFIDLLKKHLKTPEKFTTEWDYNTNLFCANLVCRIEYGATRSSPLWPDNHDFLTYLDTDNHSSPHFGMITKANNILYISYRGTLTPDEWETDFNIIQSSFLGKNVTKKNIKHSNALVPLAFIRQGTVGGAEVHQGFLQLYLVFRQKILDTITNYNKNKTKKQRLNNIYISGHSLGAAIATITGVDLSNLGYNAIVYNFASPKVGNKEFGDMMGNKLYRLVNTCDIIPNSPASVSPNFNGNHTPFMYTHCGIAKYFTLNWKSILNNHLMSVYIKGLEQFKPKKDI